MAACPPFAARCECILVCAPSLNLAASRILARGGFFIQQRANPAATWLRRPTLRQSVRSIRSNLDAPELVGRATRRDRAIGIFPAAGHGHRVRVCRGGPRYDRRDRANSALYEIRLADILMPPARQILVPHSFHFGHRARFLPGQCHRWVSMAAWNGSQGEWPIQSAAVPHPTDRK